MLLKFNNFIFYWYEKILCQWQQTEKLNICCIGGTQEKATNLRKKRYVHVCHQAIVREQVVS